jgi:hypothetical protein
MNRTHAFGHLALPARRRPPPRGDVTLLHVGAMAVGTAAAVALGAVAMGTILAKRLWGRHPRLVQDGNFARLRVGDLSVNTLTVRKLTVLEPDL